MKDDILEEILSIEDHLKGLRPFIETIRKEKANTFGMYSGCLRASLSKAFDFVDHAYKSDDNHIGFFSISSLRSICEDLIYLAFLGNCSASDRHLFLINRQILEVDQGVRRQKEFFGAFRSGQPVFDITPAPEKVEQANKRLNDFWKKYGWENIKVRKTPPTREIAARFDKGSLDILYDYIYRMTSNFVHFSPQGLLRLGFGDLSDSVVYSAKNMNRYYLMVNRIYGVFLFCLYFEYFEEFLDIDEDFRNYVVSLRFAIFFRERWPEMVTFEEMNSRVPKSVPIGPQHRKVCIEILKSGSLLEAMQRHF